MSRIVGNILAAGSGESNAPGSRRTLPADLHAPTIAPAPRLFLHNLRTAPGLVSLVFDWAQLIVFLATSSVPVVTRLGIAIGVAGGLELIKLATLAKWEVFPQVMPWSFLFAYIIQLIAAGASVSAQSFLSDWVGALTQLFVAVSLTFFCLPPFHRPFVREKIVESIWKRGFDGTKEERWKMCGPGTKFYKGALLLTGIWILVFLLMGGSAAVVAGVYPGNQPEPSWFSAVFGYVIPYVSLAAGILITRFMRRRMAGGQGQETKEVGAVPVAVTPNSNPGEVMYAAPPVSYQAPPIYPTPPINQ